MAVEVSDSHWSEVKFRNMELSQVQPNKKHDCAEDPAGFTPLTLYLVVKLKQSC